MYQARCAICAAPGVAPRCKECQAAEASIEATFTIVETCWNCTHRIYARTRQPSNGLCCLVDGKGTVPPDGFCDQYITK